MFMRIKYIICVNFDFELDLYYVCNCYHSSRLWALNRLPAPSHCCV